MRRNTILSIPTDTRIELGKQFDMVTKLSSIGVQWVWDFVDLAKLEHSIKGRGV